MTTPPSPRDPGTSSTSRSPDDHRRLRESLGAWVVGALEGPERREVEAHVATCVSCADDVADLSTLPGLLGRVSEEEAADGRLLPEPGFRDRMVGDLAGAEASASRLVARWRAAAVAALAVAAGLAVVVGLGLAGDGAPDPTPFEPLVAPVQPVVAEADATRGEASAFDWEWGTTVQLELTSLPAREVYTVWVVALDGRREQAGTWGATAARAATLRGASSIAREDIEHLEVTDADGTVLFAFVFPQG